MNPSSAAARLEARLWRFCSSAGRSALGTREPRHMAADAVAAASASACGAEDEEASSSVSQAAGGTAGGVAGGSESAVPGGSGGAVPGGSGSGSFSSSSACACSSGDRGSPCKRMAAYLAPSEASAFWQSTRRGSVEESEGSYACTLMR